jgi:hypothetical protein
LVLIGLIRRLQLIGHDFLSKQSHDTICFFRLKVPN